MFPRTAKRGLGRLKRRREFLAVQRADRKWATPGMVVQARERKNGETSDDAPRVGFTASRKVGNAVERNRVRRRLKACVAALAPDMLRPGLDIVVIARRGALERHFADLEADLRFSLKKLKSLRANREVSHA